jgi:hypothetical protein
LKETDNFDKIKFCGSKNGYKIDEPWRTREKSIHNDGPVFSIAVSWAMPIN